MKVYTTEMGQKYFCIYAVVGNRVDNDKKVTIRFYTDKDKAEENTKFCASMFHELYKNIRVNKEIVWL